MYMTTFVRLYDINALNGEHTTFYELIKATSTCLDNMNIMTGLEP